MPLIIPHRLEKKNRRIVFLLFYCKRFSQRKNPHRGEGSFRMFAADGIPAGCCGHQRRSSGNFGSGFSQGGNAHRAVPEVFAGLTAHRASVRHIAGDEDIAALRAIAGALRSGNRLNLFPFLLFERALAVHFSGAVGPSLSPHTVQNICIIVSPSCIVNCSVFRIIKSYQRHFFCQSLKGPRLSLRRTVPSVHPSRR